MTSLRRLRTWALPLSWSLGAPTHSCPISLLTMVKPAYLDWRVMSWRLNENVACVPSL
jgi:hypothetical protein